MLTEEERKKIQEQIIGTGVTLTDTMVTEKATIATLQYAAAKKKLIASLLKSVGIFAAVTAAVVALVAIVKHFQDISIDG